jgi:hypothetical protein
VGRISSQFANRMKKNSEIASGATNGWTLPRLSSTWSLTCLTIASQSSWSLVGTWSSAFLVSARRARNPSRSTTAPATSVEMIVSMWKV